MPLDVGKLKAAQEDLNKRSSGAKKNWLQLSKIETPIDIRVMDPLPSMEGIFYIEVPVWWIGTQRLISPRFVTGEKTDIISEIIEEAKASRDKTLDALLKAKDERGNPKIKESVEFWIPVLQFAWEIKGDQIVGITDKTGNVDPELIRKYVVDDRVKFMTCSITPVKEINKIATSRGGANMTDRVKGFNLIASKSGKGRDTKYSIVSDQSGPMEMPKHYYDNPVDPFEVAQAQMFDDAYLESVICNYLYDNTPILEKDDHYLYPEIREKLKDRNKDDEEEQAKPARPTRGKAVDPDAGSTVSSSHTRVTIGKQEEGPQAPAPAGRTRVAAAPAAATPRVTRTPAAGPRRGGRNIVEDIREAEE